MALPTTVFSGAGLPGHHPPCKSSGGNFYVVSRKDADELEVYKATDPTGSWTLTDTADSPFHSGTILGYSSVQDGDVIHIVAWSVAGYEYYTFNMATDQWVVDENIEFPLDAPTLPWASIARRASPAATIIAYAADTDQVMGGKKERVDYAIRPDSSGTWDTLGAALDAAGDNHYANPICVLGSNDGVHFMWQYTSNTADPPTSWDGGSNQYRTLDSANNLSTVASNAANTSSYLLGVANAVSYDDSGTQRIAWIGALVGSLRSWRSTEDGSDDIQTATSILDEDADAYVNGEVGIVSLAEVDGILHAVYSGGTTSGTDQDIYYVTSDDDGAIWDTPTEILDAVTCNYISGNIYTRNRATVLAYLYDDGGTQKYNEYELVAAPPLHEVFYKPPALSNTLLRM